MKIDIACECDCEVDGKEPEETGSDSFVEEGGFEENFFEDSFFENTGTCPEDAPLILESLVGYNLRRAHSMQRTRFAAVFGPYNVRPVQLSILGLVRDHPQIKQSDLGKALEIKRANIVALLDELESRKLIVRKQSESDRRAYVLELTPIGRDVAAKLLALHTRLEADIVSQLGVKESEQLLKLLKKLRRIDASPDLDEG